MYADDRTYPNYKKSREILENITPNDPLLEDKMAIVNKLIAENRLINENSGHYYNMIVLDKAQRWINDDLKHIYLKKPNPDGTYDECIEFHVLDNDITNIIRVKVGKNFLYFFEWENEYYL